jgi:hypothetical protein
MLVASRAGAGQNGHVYMSPEFLAIIGVGVTSIATTLGGFAWLVSRMDRKFEGVDAKFERVDARFDARFEGIDAKFERIDAKFDAKFDRIDVELVEIKVAIARLEGARPRLLMPR